MSENLHIAITGDNQGFINALNGARAGVRSTAREVEQSGGSIEQMFNRIKIAATGALAGFSAKAFISQVVQIRGEFQQLEAAFTTLLGSAEKAQSMMGDLTKLAATTPFDLKGVASGAQQLLAYGVAAGEITDTLTRLGDIAAGLSLPLNDLVYLYGTTLTQGRMYTQDLRQFMGRGIPMAEELAKQFGVTKDKVGELVTAGKVGAEEFKKAIKSMSDEGGQFGGLMDMQSKTITGQISNIEDNIDMMFNNIGKNSEGIINDALSGVGTLVENYETVGKVLLGLVATYGTYKAAVMTVAAIESLQALGVGALTAAETAHYGAIVLVEKAQKLLNATMLSNPYVLVATAIAGVVAVMMTMKSQQDLVNEASEQYNREKDEAIKKEQEHAAEIDKLCQMAGDESLATDTRKEALVRLELKYPSIFKKYDTEYEKLKHIRDIKQEIAQLEGKTSRANAKNELGNINKDIAKLESSLKARQTGNRGKYLDYYVGTNTSVLQARLTALHKEQSTLSKTVTKNAAVDYLKDLTGVSNNQLQAQITQRENLLAKMSLSGKKYGKINYGGAQGTFSKDELEAQLQTLQSEQKRRRQVLSDGSKDFTTEAHKAYNREKKALDNLRALTDPKKRSKSRMSVEVGGKQKRVSELSADEYADAVTNQQKKVDEAAKKYKGLSGNSPTKGGGGSAASSVKKEQDDREQAEKESAQRAERLKEETQRWDEETAKERLNSVYAQEEARISAITDGAEKEREERKLQYRKDLDQVNQQERDFRKQNYEHNKTVYENSGKGRKNKYTGTIAGTSLTEDQQAQVEAQRKKIEADWNQYLLEQQQKEAQTLNDYLKEYGSMQEKRLAIAKEYDDKISKAETEGDRLSLVAQKTRALADFDTENEKSNLNWEDVFGNLDSFTKDQLDRIKQQLKEMLSSGDLNIDGYKDVVDQIDKVNDAILSAEDKQRSFLGVAVSYNTERRKLEMDVADALDRQNQAMQEMANASAALTMQKFSTQQLLSGYGINVQQGDIRTSNANSILKQVGDKYGTDSEPYKKVKDALDKLAKSESSYNNVVEKKKKADTDATQKQSKLNKYLADFAEKLNDLMPLLEQINSNIQDIPGLLSTLGVSEDSSLGKAASAFADGSNSAMSAAKDYMSGNYVGAAMNGLKAVGSYVQSATNLFAGAGNEAKMEAEIEKLSESNGDLAAAIDSLSDTISDADNTNKQSVEAYKKALDAEKERESNERTMMNDRASEYSNSGHGFLGMSGKHSFNVYADRNRGNWLSAFNAALTQNGYTGNLKSVADVWKLSPEEMKVLRDFSPEAWTKFFNSGGQSNPKELAEEYIEMAGKMQDLTDSLNEKLTGYSWDSFKDGYESVVEDMSSDFDDLGDHIEEVLTKAVVSSMMNDEFKDRIKEIYDYLANAASDGDLSIEELNKIRQMNESVSKDIMKRRQQLIDTGMIKDTSSTYSQDVSKGSWQSMGEDTAQELNGRFTALQEAGERISDGVQTMVVTMNSLYGKVDDGNITLTEIRNLMITNNAFLEDILSVNKKYYESFKQSLVSLQRTK